MNNPYIPPKSENEKIAKRLIEMGVFDCSEEDELKDTQIYFLQDWLINALDERIDYLNKRLQKEKDKSWWEGFDTCKAKAGEANVKLSEELETERKKNAELTEQIEELKCCANCKYEEQGYMVEPCKSCNRYFQRLKVGARDKWEKR